MRDFIEQVQGLVGFLADLLARPNALTIISMALLFFLGRKYWKELDLKVRGCEAKHSKCERRLGVVLRLLHGALEQDAISEAARSRRAAYRRAEDQARAEGMATLRRTLNDLLHDIEREESSEEDRLLESAK